MITAAIMRISEHALAKPKGFRRKRRQTEGAAARGISSDFATTFSVIFHPWVQKDVGHINQQIENNKQGGIEHDKARTTNV